jgi:hypothetical protein|tara:strand:- start:5539 stop:6945 length:1407 start_codon:yes stop_codon:yes gene_type:complete
MKEFDNMLETDYLIVGAGASGMAFADILLTETDANIIIVDKFHKPGGHWNFAYPFVKLHQPSSFYGVSSSKLGYDTIDGFGFNRGLISLATGDTIRAYYDDIMQRRFLPSGHVQYFPLSEYQGNSTFKSLLSGKNFKVKVNIKTVDATHMKTKIPATHVPNFSIDPEVPFISINELPNLKTTPSGFVIIGGGKTGVDACLWLLENGVDPKKITWIVNRDSWFTNRINTQPSPKYLINFLSDLAAQFESLAQAQSISDLFHRLEKTGVLLRIDQQISPKMFHGATVSELELEQLRRIKNIIRKGHVKQIEKDKIILEQAELTTNPDSVFVDCSAAALCHREMKPIFSGNTITIQSVRTAQLVFSAALIAHVECQYSDENFKNEICREIPMPDHDTDWIKNNAISMMNQYKWSKNPELSEWLYNNRLDGFSHLVANISPDDIEKNEILDRISQSIKPAMAKIQEFAAQLK